MKKTKIICTLGPACDDPSIMKKMLNAGMDAARFNFSHGSHREHLRRLERFRQVRDELGVSAATILDTRGPEIRIGCVKNDRMLLTENQKFCLSCDPCIADDSKVTVSYKNLYREINCGDEILIDDGKIRMEAEAIQDKAIVCRVVSGGYISSNKGVNVPGVHLNFRYLTSKDRQDILFGIQNGFDYIAASFIRSARDVMDIKKFLSENGGEDIKIISKIENKDGIDNFREILLASDGIMIARGDMGVEIEYSRLPGIQKKIIKRCNECGKIVITATQMLESMVNSLLPTRAEITDIANAVFDGTSAVMLSGESAAGKHPAEAVASMAKIIRQAEHDMCTANFSTSAVSLSDLNNVSNAIGHAACTTARDISASALLALTTSGYTAQKMSKFRPCQPIFAATSSHRTYHRMSLFWGVSPLFVQKSSSYELMYNTALKQIKKFISLKTGDYIVTSAGFPLNVEGNTNMIRVEVIE